MSAAQPVIRTFLGFRVWPATILKPMFPFLISGTMSYFVFNWAGTKLKDDPEDKWANIVSNVTIATEKQALKNEAQAWYDEQTGKKPASKH
ncbi:hypothetical protein HDU84_009682 [Entophlyctis sp. JEL0112]|nr:hypothetical protein HDU84_009682 [Entophlyctis sp. JEL0112]